MSYLSHPVYIDSRHLLHSNMKKNLCIKNEIVQHKIFLFHDIMYGNISLHQRNININHFYAKIKISCLQHVLLNDTCHLYSRKMSTKHHIHTFQKKNTRKPNGKRSKKNRGHIHSYTTSSIHLLISHDVQRVSPTSSFLPPPESIA